MIMIPLSTSLTTTATTSPVQANILLPIEMGSRVFRMGSWASPNTEDGHVPEVEDVYEVRRMLLRWVPAELALNITDDAEYWSCSAFVAVIDSKSSSITEYSGPICCLLTPKLGEWMNLERDKRIIQGEYAGSWTWFEAVIVREFKANVNTAYISEYLEKRGTIRVPLLNEDEETKTFGNEFGQLTTVKNPNETEKDVWHIQRNARASRTERTHQIFWTDDQDPREGPLNESGFVDSTGTGTGAGFVRSLKPTDQIAVIGRAKYRGWENCVKAVEVQVVYSV
ncbi:hypothetical protein D9613_004051 [Agrocybe pediades]|uniref:Uncharacterized protein n=1 Tax=Agrocybe pediades TaxID=84607 RepID=A0A8H4VLH9_9AGAR|nr:hypothetical protein D9613_004051 [Agrocybe pediades]